MSHLLTTNFFSSAINLLNIYKIEMLFCIYHVLGRILNLTHILLNCTNERERGDVVIVVDAVVVVVVVVVAVVSIRHLSSGAS